MEVDQVDVDVVRLGFFMGSLGRDRAILMEPRGEGVRRRPRSVGTLRGQRLPREDDDDE